MTIARSLLSGIMMVGIWIPHPFLHSHPRPSTPQCSGTNQKFSKNFLILVIWGQLWWWEIPHWSDLINYIRHQTSDNRWKIKVSFVNLFFFPLISCWLNVDLGFARWSLSSFQDPTTSAKVNAIYEMQPYPCLRHTLLLPTAIFVHIYVAPLTFIYVVEWGRPFI